LVILYKPKVLVCTVAWQCQTKILLVYVDCIYTYSQNILYIPCFEQICIGSFIINEKYIIEMVIECTNN
jgi:hypothetical protein